MIAVFKNEPKQSYITVWYCFLEFVFIVKAERNNILYFFLIEVKC